MAAELGLVCKTSSKDGRKGSPGSLERVALGTLGPGLGHKCCLTPRIHGLPCIGRDR